MKRIVIIVLAAVMCLSVVSCGGNKLDKACEKADDLVSGWHNERLNGCIYKGEYTEEVDGYEISLYIVSVRYPNEIDDLEVGAAYMKEKIAYELENTLYPDLVKVFEGLDVSVSFILSDWDGENTYCTILDGEVTHV